MTPGLAVLAVDDEPPALDELAFLLRSCPLVADVSVAADSADALRQLQQRPFDLVLLDIAMPGLSGMELASVLSRFARPPAVVFVTAHEEYALAAFDVGAVGYLLKPVEEHRLVQVLERQVRLVGLVEGPAGTDNLDSVPVELGGRMALVPRSEIDWVESAGDYVRLHVRDGRSHLVRLSLARLEEAWAGDGFARIHRQYLVCLRAVTELRTDGAQTVVRLGDRELPVSRRHLRELRDRLVRHARSPR